MTQATITLRFVGTDLKPKVLTRLFNVSPTTTYSRGDSRGPNATKHGIPPYKVGAWLYSEDTAKVADLDAVLQRIVKIAPVGWCELSGLSGIQGDVFVGLFLSDDQNGFHISVETIQLLNERNLEVVFDVYCSDLEGE